MDTWIRNIEASRAARGAARLFVIVSGSAADAQYWDRHLRAVGPDLFGAPLPHIVSLAEESPKGNFLGSIRAFALAADELRAAGLELPAVGMMSMVFGRGQRLSPFTQALGNRKPALPTPLRGPASGAYLRVADLSTLYGAHWVRTLGDAGFRGLVVKWGDEALIPGTDWRLAPGSLADVDAVRFVWITEPTGALAGEKEWLVVDPVSGEMRRELSRAPLGALRARVAQVGEGCTLGVNLGSFAVSYDLLAVATAVLREQWSDRLHAADWDPFVWIALTSDEEEWRAEIEHQDRLGGGALRALLDRWPDFYDCLRRVRDTLEERRGRRLRTVTLDFGDTFWFDAGLHGSLRRSLEALTERSREGAAMRALFGLPEAFDARGNLIHDSVLAPDADVRDSVIVGGTVSSADSVLRGAVVVGGSHGVLRMPHGGAALFCASPELDFAGPRAIAFRVAGEATLGEGDRLTTLLLDGERMNLRANETIGDFRGESYTSPVLGNPISFEEAARRMQAVDPADLEARWHALLRAAGSAPARPDSTPTGRGER